MRMIADLHIHSRYSRACSLEMEVKAVEVNNINRQAGRLRKIHTLIVAPNLQVADKINQRLRSRGNLSADGRPTFTFPAKDLVKLVLDISQDSLKTHDSERFLFTIEFFPEEGKYHYDGHRKCGVVLSPKETKRQKGLCPVCGARITVGVMHRVDDLADREEGHIPLRAIPAKHLVPLEVQVEPGYDGVYGKISFRPSKTDPPAPAGTTQLELL